MISFLFALLMQQIPHSRCFRKLACNNKRKCEDTTTILPFILTERSTQQMIYEIFYVTCALPFFGGANFVQVDIVKYE